MRQIKDSLRVQGFESARSKCGELKRFGFQGVRRTRTTRIVPREVSRGAFPGDAQLPTTAKLGEEVSMKAMLSQTQQAKQENW